jgi:hypothetical protein
MDNRDTHQSLASGAVPYSTFFLYKKKYSSETRSRGSTWDPADPGLKPGRVEEKMGEGKTRCDLARPGQDPVANLLTFFFFFLLKRRRFDLKKKN